MISSMCGARLADLLFCENEQEVENKTTVFGMFLL